MWDLPGPGLQPVSPALAGGFSTSAPPGKPARLHLNQFNFSTAFGAWPSKYVIMVLTECLLCYLVLRTVSFFIPCSQSGNLTVWAGNDGGSVFLPV